MSERPVPSDDDSEDNAILRKYRPDLPKNKPSQQWDDGTPDGKLDGGNVTSKKRITEEEFYDDDMIDEQRKRLYPSPSYCTAEEVYETLGMWDHKLQRRKGPSDMDVMDVDTINMNILAMEDRIDHETFNTWRAKRVKDKILQLKTYQNDALSFRTTMISEGGNYALLHRNVLPWDPEQGDELWWRTLGGQWANWTDRVQTGYDDTDSYRIWFDYDKGKMFVNTLYYTRGSQFRISYRYGNPDGVPWDIRRACCLLAAIQLIQSDWYVTRIGTGGDMGSTLDKRIQNMKDEAHRILALNQRATIARPAYG